MILSAHPIVRRMKGENRLRYFSKWTIVRHDDLICSFRVSFSFPSSSIMQNGLTLALRPETFEKKVIRKKNETNKRTHETKGDAQILPYLRESPSTPMVKLVNTTTVHSTTIR